MQNYSQLIFLCFDKFEKHFQSDFLALQQHHDLLHSVFCLTYKLQNLEDALPKTGETGGSGRGSAGQKSSFKSPGSSSTTTPIMSSSDRSWSDLEETTLEGEKISCFAVGG